MKHITYAEKSLLVGDAAADAITQYAAVLGKAGSADTVTLSAYGADGDDVEATFILNSGTVLMSESTHSSIPEPDNSQAVEYMRQRTQDLISPRHGMATAEEIPGYFDEL